MRAWDALPALAGVVIAAPYVVAVADATVAARVAGSHVRASTLLVAPLREAARLWSQRATRTERPDRGAALLAAPLLLGLAAVMLAALPLGEGVGVADVDDGIVLWGAAAALVMVGVFLHGWAPNSAFPLVGAYRFAAQALSYQIPMLLVLLGTAIPARSLRFGDVVASQHHLWNVARQPLGLPLLLAAGFGLAFLGPLRTPDAADLAGGAAAETAGRPLLAWRFAQALLIAAVALTAAVAFLGGWQGPVLPGPVWLALKSLALVLVLLAAAHRVPRVRLERFVTWAWVVMIPAALVDVFGAGILGLWTTP